MANESTIVRPSRRFFVRREVLVNDVQAKFRNAESISELLHFHNPAHPVPDLKAILIFGRGEERYLSVQVGTFCRCTKFRIDVVSPDGEQLGSVSDYGCTERLGVGLVLSRLLKLEDLEGVDKMTVLFQLELLELPIEEFTAVVTSPTPSSCPTVSQDYSNLFESGEHADITFLVGGQKIAGHKCVFVARSSVFARMFDSNMSEAISNEVEIKDIRPEVFREMAKFIYSGEKPTFLATKKEESEDNDDRQEDDDGNDDRQADDDGNNDRHADDDGNDDRQEDDDNDNDNNNNDRLELEQTATDLLLAADKYGIEELKSMCEAFLCDNLHPDNVIQLLIVAHLSNCAELMRQAGHVYRMFSRDSQLREGKKQLEKYPGLLMKLLDLCCDG